MKNRRNNMFGINENIVKGIHYFILIGMLHSTFVAPAQNMLIDYYFGSRPISASYTNFEYPSFKDDILEEIVIPDDVNSKPDGQFYSSVQTPKETEVSQVFYADINQGVIGVTEDLPLDNVKDNLFKFSLDKIPADSKVLLKYDLYGLSDTGSVSRSINDMPSTGGHIISKNNSWTPQEEELDRNWVRQGENTILFTAPSISGFGYKIKNVRIEFAKTDSGSFSSALMLNVDSKSLFYKDNTLYIKGFVRDNTEGLRVEVEGNPLSVYKNQFEGLITLTEAIFNKNHILIKAYDNKGLLGQELIVLDNLKEADFFVPYEENVAPSVQLFPAFEKGEFFIDGAGIIVSDSALYQTKNISLNSLRKKDIAPLNSGMINVTKAGSAFRFLPDGTKFEKDVKILIAYDSNLIPKGYTEKDIKTYFFNKSSKSWVAVEKDSVDVNNKIIISKTNHFTDYINGIIQVPESPQTSAFIPTMMSDIQAVNPASEITVIAPPSVSQTGEAGLSYPFHLPMGRNGLQPQLGLQYSSDGDSGWAGLGWNLSIPAVTIDTRWGTPTFNSTGESELYMLNGQQLMYPDNYLPHRHRELEQGVLTTQMQGRNEFLEGSVKIFTPRKQGSFEKIERMGNNPTNYYWKVTQTDGTVSWYGGDNNGIKENTIIRNPQTNNILHWGVSMVEDVFGNNIQYEYTATTISDNTNLNGGKAFHIKDIFYTGYDGEKGNYRVNFKTSSQSRIDTRINGRLGIKQVDPYLLEEVSVWYKDDKIRSYNLDFGEGDFFKTVLISIRETSGNGEHTFKHSFEYYKRDPKEISHFSSPVNIDLPNVNPSYILNIGNLLNASKINTNENTEFGYEIRPGFGMEFRIPKHSNKEKKTLMFHLPFGETSGPTKGKVTLTDIDGDGIDDVLYRASNGLKYVSGNYVVQEQENFSGFSTNNFGNSASKNIHNISDFHKGSSYSKWRLLESFNINFGRFYGGKNRTVTENHTDIYLVDGNNDGITDIVRNGIVYFNTINSTTGEPVFSTSSEPTENMLITAEPAMEWSLPEEYEEEEMFEANYDMVRFWQAPRDGEVKITTNATLLNTEKTAVLTIETLVPPGSTSTPCTGVSNLNIYYTGGTLAFVVWEGNDSQVGYNWELYPAGANPNTSSPIQQGYVPYNLGTFLIITGLTPFTTYDFYISADCGHSQSDVSDPFTFTTDPSEMEEDCPEPTNVNVTYLFQTLAVITWDGAASHTGYEWYVYDGNSIVATGNTILPQTVVSGLNPNSSYTFYVSAFCDDIQTPHVGDLSFTTPEIVNTVPCTPTNKYSIKDITCTSATISWASTSVDNYIWEVYSGNTLVNSGVIPGTQNQIIITGLSPDTNYNFYLTKQCGDIQNLSLSVSFTTTNDCSCYQVAFSYKDSGVGFNIDGNLFPNTYYFGNITPNIPQFISDFETIFGITPTITPLPSSYAVLNIPLTDISFEELTVLFPGTDSLTYSIWQTPCEPISQNCYEVRFPYQENIRIAINGVFMTGYTPFPPFSGYYNLGIPAELNKFKLDFLITFGVSPAVTFETDSLGNIIEVIVQAHSDYIVFDSLSIVTISNQILTSYDFGDCQKQLAFFGGDMFSSETNNSDCIFSEGDNCVLYGTTLNSSNSSINQTITNYGSDCGSGILKVKKGDRIYFRLHNSNDPSAVNWEHRVEYVNTSISGITDMNGLSPNNSTYEDSFFLNGSGLASFSPTSSTASVTWNSFNVVYPTDEIVYKVSKFVGNQEIVLYSKVCPPNQTTLVNPVGLNNINVSDPNGGEDDDSEVTLYFSVSSSSNVKWQQYEWKPKVNSTYTVQDIVQNYTQHIIPEYSTYKLHLCASSYNKIPTSPFNTGSILTIKPLLNGIFSTEDVGKVIDFVVKKDNSFVGSRKGTVIYHPNIGITVIFDNTAPITIPSVNDGSLEVCYYTSYENKSLITKILDYQGALASVYNGSYSFNLYKNMIGLYTSAKDGLGHMYNGWGQFFYNPNLDNNQQTPVHTIYGKLINNNIVNNQLNTNSELSGFIQDIIANSGCSENLPPEEYQDCVENALGESLNLPEEGDIEGNNLENILDGLLNDFGYLFDDFSAVIYIPEPYREVSQTGEINHWKGMFDSQYTANKKALSGGFQNLGMDNIFPDTDEDSTLLQADLQTGMFAPSSGLFHKSTSHSFSAGYGIHTLSKSYSGYSHSLVSFIDLNGDGYPDMLYSDNQQTTTMTGGHRSPSGNHGFGAVSKSDSDNLGLTTSLKHNKAGKPKTLKRTTSRGKTDYGTGQMSAGIGIGLSASLDGENQTNEYWMDVNGDGLSDRIVNTSNGFKYQLGQVNGAVSESYHNLISEVSSPGDLAINLGIDGVFNLILNNFANEALDVAFSVSLALGYSANKSNVKSTFTDVNGDGLVDILVADTTPMQAQTFVYYNTGHSFSNQPEVLTVQQQSSSAITLSEKNKNKSVALSGSVGAYAGFPICCPFPFIGFLPIIHIKPVGATAELNGGLGISETVHDFKDFNGDGYVDYVEFDNSSNSLKVYYSQLGVSNKLKSIKTPLTHRGGGYEIGYRQSPPTYDNPNPKWVMSSLLTRSGSSSSFDLSPSNILRFSYENGKYDRREREFYGFETVISKQHAIDENGSEEPCYRSTVSKYYNNSYYLNGLLKEQYIAKGEASGEVQNDISQNQVFVHSENEYKLYGLQQGNMTIDLTQQLPEDYDVGGTEGRSTAVALLTKTTNSMYELGDAPMISVSEMIHDNYGRISTYTYHGDPSDSSDNYNVNISYHNSSALLNNHLRNIPEEVKVLVGGQTVRQRQTLNINPATGMIGKIVHNITSQENAATELVYDQYGNLTKILLPPNNNNEAMFYEHTYDSVENKYVVSTKDAFGYDVSSKYNYFFDKVVLFTDQAGNSMEYNYDTFGRVIKIKGPKEIADQKPYTIKYDYYYEREDSMNIALCISGKTSHYDVQHPGNDIETVVLIDDFARPRAILKDIEIEGQEYMSISGDVLFDAFGRAIINYLPGYAEKGGWSTPNCKYSPLGNTFEDAHYTETLYDELDRVIQSIDPEGNESFTEYTIDDGLFITHSKIQQTSSVDIISETFGDVNNRIIKTKNVGPGGDIFTHFTYNAIGELLSYTDDEGIETSYNYDWLGRRTAVNHPDNGTTKYSYDGAGNLDKLQTANLAIQDKYIEYLYEYNRLVAVIFPENQQGIDNISNVYYHYGAPNSGNQSGRLILQQDASGVQEFKYGNMGEVIYSKRTVVAPSPNLPTRTFETQFSYDSWNRMQTITYPDSEQVDYYYNLGGNLREVKNSEFKYIEDIKYDHYEQRVYLKYGNGTESHYTYSPELQRLYTLDVLDSNSQNLLKNVYEYDKAGNVTGVVNGAAYNTSNYMGGGFDHSYSYDNLNRLVGAKGSFYGHPSQQGIGNDFQSGYDLSMKYNTTHGIVVKEQIHDRNGQTYLPNTYIAEYKYFDGTHKVKEIIDNNNVSESFDYDLNGNNVFRHKNDTGIALRYYWDEVNRLRIAEEPELMHHYIYDASGERVLKASSHLEAVYENGELVYSGVQMDNYTTYPNAFLVVDPDGRFSKHYYAGTQRFASRIGDTGAEIFEAQQRPMSTETSEVNYDEIKQLQIADLQYYLEKSGKGTVTFKAYRPDKEEEEEDIRDIESDFSYMAAEQGGLYFYHPDHLGTATFLTDLNGLPYEFFLNLPFGETMAEQHSQTEDYINRWKFTGHELDRETGLYYAGARYYDPKISIWLSVDPFAEEYPNWTPYNYTLQNPVNYIDPNGEFPIRLILSAGKLIKRAYKIYKKTGKLSPQSLKKAGLDEFVDIAGDLYTIFDGDSSYLDKIGAGVDLIIGSEFNNNGNKAVRKSFGIDDNVKDVEKKVDNVLDATRGKKNVLTNSQAKEFAKEMKWGDKLSPNEIPESILKETGKNPVYFDKKSKRYYSPDKGGHRADDAWKQYDSKGNRQTGVFTNGKFEKVSD